MDKQTPFKSGLAEDLQKNEQAGRNGATLTGTYLHYVRWQRFRINLSTTTLDSQFVFLFKRTRHELLKSNIGVGRTI